MPARRRACRLARHPDADGGRVRGIWAELAEMGVPGAAVPEAAGGLGLDACDLVGMLEECGRAALPLPVVETVFVAGPLLAAAGGHEPLLERLTAGDLLAGAALDGGSLVPYASVADVLLLGDAREARSIAGRGDQQSTAADGELRLVEAPAFEPVASVDGARAPGRVADAATAGVALDADPADVAAAWNRGALGTAAQLVGLARTLLAMATEYAQERRQFGVAIGTFQAVKHQLANALLAVEFAAPAVLRAAWSLDTGAPSADRDVAMAKALASDAAERVAAVALQAHGAIAYTTEYDLHLFAKRVWATSRTWGDADWQRARVAAALGLTEAGATR